MRPDDEDSGFLFLKCGAWHQDNGALRFNHTPVHTLPVPNSSELNASSGSGRELILLSSGDNLLAVVYLFITSEQLIILRMHCKSYTLKD